MSKIVESVIIDAADVEKLKISAYRYQGIKDYANEVTAKPATHDARSTVATLIGEAYRGYQEQWKEILNKYFPNKDYSTGNYSWNCVYDTNTVTIIEAAQTQ